MYCSKCGKIILDVTDNFCAGCGNSFNSMERGTEVNKYFTPNDYALSYQMVGNQYNQIAKVDGKKDSFGTFLIGATVAATILWKLIWFIIFFCN